MSAKLVVHKFDSGINFQTLYLTIDDCDSDNSTIKFSHWSQGKSKESKKDYSRLVVKIVTEKEQNKYFNLDLCAKEVGDVKKILTNINSMLSKDICKYNIHPNDSKEGTLPCGQRIHDMKKIIYDFKDDIHSEKNLPKISSTTDMNTSPLEHSLERVKENNARIMEGINMLNRTLNFTKNKEILESVFPKPMRSYPCSTCGKCFVYETGLKRHYTMRHAANEIQLRWQVVWTCVECFQVWPRHDLAINHSFQCCKTENTEYVREIKTSLLLQCEFCEKVFTNIPRLLKHSKTHTTANNYQCKACDMVFSSYKTAEQHWLLCPWLKLYYNFYLHKMLLCNSCDKKFRSYDQLYSHRYKVCHFMTKPHHIDSGKSLDVTVYQCEVCAQWFPSSDLLRKHRSQYHPCYDTQIFI